MLSLYINNVIKFVFYWVIEFIIKKNASGSKTY